MPQTGKQDLRAAIERRLALACPRATQRITKTSQTKWGSELRVYFNDHGFAALLTSLGVHVEFPRKGYKAGEYRFRFNDNSMWWKLVEVGGLRLGPN